jgi:uncharacterized GH25 family protein
MRKTMNTARQMKPATKPATTPDMMMKTKTNAKKAPLRVRLRVLMLAAAFSLLPPSPAAAHEFWMKSEPYSPVAGAAVDLTLWFGEYYAGEGTPFIASHLTLFSQYSAGGEQDLLPRLPRAIAAPRWPVQAGAAGTQMLALDTGPSVISLAPDKFSAYLHDEGLDTVNRIRVATGRADTPGRERYRRNVKTLLRVGGASDGTYAVRTGQRLEIVPLSDPLAARPGETLALQLFFDRKPLADALLKAWIRREEGGPQVMQIRARTDADGRAGLTLPWAGAWMLSVVHMIPAVGAADADWDSYWGNLTFEMLP